MKKVMMGALAICLLIACGEKKAETTLSGLKKADFQTEVDGKKTDLFVLSNKNGAEVCITNYGGRIVSIMVPDKNDQPTDVVLGYDSIAQYIATDGNYGALIGRYGNRINEGKFTLDSVEYQLPQNDNALHCLHGGPQGFHVQMWDAKQLTPQSLELTYVSKDGEAGFPGNLNVKVIYALTDDNALDIQYEATTDKATVVNLTNHTYFNLSGDLTKDVLEQLVQINADRYTPVDSLLIPTGELAPVDSTPLDLRRLTPIGKFIDANNEQMKRGRGYDFNWVLNTAGDINAVAAKVVNFNSGIALEVYTNEPGVQFYTGNFMKGDDKGKGGKVYAHRGAFCLETQHFPDSPNHPDFPSTVLRPGETYKSECIYKFSVEK